MLRKNAAKDKIRRGQIPIGSVVLITDPTLAEILGLSGFDYLVFDGEHGTLTPQLLGHLVRACEAVGVVPMARLPALPPPQVLPFLETGILGLMQAHVRSAEEATQLVQAAKYAPVGSRGLGTGRPNMYGAVPAAEHARTWNEEFLTIAQLEDKAALDDLDNILRVEGLDACYVASNDLAHSLGFTGRADDPAFRQIQADVAKRVKAGGKWVGMGARPPYSPAEGKRLADLGVDLFSFAAAGFISRMSRDLLTETRSLIEGPARN